MRTVRSNYDHPWQHQWRPAVAAISAWLCLSILPPKKAGDQLRLAHWWWRGPVWWAHYTLASQYHALIVYRRPVIAPIINEKRRYPPNAHSRFTGTCVMVVNNVRVSTALIWSILRFISRLFFFRSLLHSTTSRVSKRTGTTSDFGTELQTKTPWNICNKNVNYGQSETALTVWA